MILTSVSARTLKNKMDKETYKALKEIIERTYTFRSLLITNNIETERGIELLENLKMVENWIEETAKEEN